MKKLHAHLYFDANEQTLVEDIVRRLAARPFPIQFSELTLSPVGPHPKAMLEIHFDSENLNAARKWLRQHRKHLSVLIHEDTNDDARDHTVGIEWLGEKLTLDFGFFELIKKRPDLKIHP